MVIYLLIAGLTPVMLLTVITYGSIYSILENKIKNGIFATLTQERIGLENVLNNLDFASRQLAVDGKIVNDVQQYLTPQGDSFDKATMSTNIKDKINMISYTNLNLGMIFYYEPESSQPYKFENLQVDPALPMKSLPHFTEYQGAVYFGPHKTMYKSSNNIVFSSLRKLETKDNLKLYVYLETNYNLFRKILNHEAFGIEVSHLLINARGEVTYMENEKAFSESDSLRIKQAVDHEEEYKGYMLFNSISEQGWQLVIAVKKTTYNQEIYAWLRKIAVLVVATTLFALLLAFIIWKTIYRPMKKLNKEIIYMAENRNSPVQFTHVEEFDHLLINFQDMKLKINALIAEVEENGKEKSRLEVEKLLTQINPHFLHNTLNTVQWLARMNGQKEIDRLVTLLVKVLHYNLGKQSMIVTVQEEVEALNNYIELQRIRYDHEFDVRLDMDASVRNAAIPRFLLQPLVENAIYHGNRERNNYIEVAIHKNEGNILHLQVSDNGQGMDAQTLHKLLTANNEHLNRGLGIGLQYVSRLIKRYYGEASKMSIDSIVDKGTVIRIEIPVMSKEDFDD
ncbi:sensor histidine kinase [Paenibacillus sp. LMG 31461]|uniref:histidine kinase n=1 Tax=Paenibacillus plantarum TaxID=2654975 RepID=A0ABX1X6Z3_9BACL|nr:histidine kinase [Paenibacillus plantarum]NOU63981.1 sensor histidine kinase [Paenibacillus plantarum]